MTRAADLSFGSGNHIFILSATTRSIQLLESDATAQVALKMFLAKFAVAIAVVNVLAEVQSDSNTLEYPQLNIRSPEFVYRCDERKGTCAKTELRTSNATLPPFAWSGSACRLRCGRAGALWPLPTGGVRLGPRVMAVLPGDLILPGLSNSEECSTSPRVRRLIRAAHNSFIRRLQSEEAAGRAVFTRSSFRAAKATRPKRGTTSHPRLDVEVCVASSDVSLDWSTDESYTLSGLTAGSSGGSSGAGGDRVIARIDSRTFFGARHALETLSQLITHTGPRPGDDFDGHLVIVDGFSVTDAPDFPHRGLLLDTARNYYSPAYIRATINAMAQNKLNVLHWHITDSQSFPYESRSFPQMSAYGAYSERETYPARTIRELSRFALSRGVRLLPELDAPAHVAAGWTWGPDAGLGDLVVCANQQPWSRYCIEPPCGQLNPANPNVYNVLYKLFEDMLSDFYDGANAPAFHMGGDEVHLGCWNSSSQVVDYLARVLGRPKRRKEDFIELWGHFQERATRALDHAQVGVALEKETPEETTTTESDNNSVLRRREASAADSDDTEVRPRPEMDNEYQSNGDAVIEVQQTASIPIPVILWTSELTGADVVEKYLDKDRYVIQLWLRAGDALAKALVSKGYRVIVSTKDAWYLDHGFGNWKGNSTSGYGYHPWQVAYDNDPTAGLGITAETRRLVLGGEAAIWSEQADPSGANTKIWPRSAAVAERLWSGSRAGTWTAARIRFVRHRDRMARLGTPSEAVQPDWCTQHEGDCY